MLRSFFITFLLALSFFSYGEIYIYQGPDGQKILSDKPIQQVGYQLEHLRKNATDAGHILAGREKQVLQKKADFFDRYINRASERFDVDPALIKAVIRVESNFNPYAVSPKGARGLMQIMPQTATRYRNKKFRAVDLFSPLVNIDTGVRHLSYLLKRYPNNLKFALAAYNAGEGSVARYNGIPPYRETQGYVKRVMHFHELYRAL